MTAKEARDNIGGTVIYQGRPYRLLELIYWWYDLDEQFHWSAMLVERETNTSLRVPLEEVEGCDT